MNTRFISFFVCLFLISHILTAQIPSIKGTIVDAESKETLIGCTTVIQGTTISAITDFNGVFELHNIAPGSYNLVVSYVSYEQQIFRVEVQKNQTTSINILLKQSTVVLDDIKVVATKRTNTELSMMSAIKASNIISSGISSQQILKSQDKDASEIVKRIPGINIRDGRFIIVRGLSERYNTVWLNGTPAPSSESNIRAFSFDVIPANQLDNIMIFKSPAPELPADFAGGAIKITTKNNADENNISISYGLGFQEGTTFNKIYGYQGGKTDWLGYDDGTRALPAGTPSTVEIRNWHDTKNKTTDEIAVDRQKATDLGRSFNKIWTPNTKKATPDQRFSFEMTRRFLAGPISIGAINAITYNNSNDYNKISRAGYQTYYTFPDSIYSYKDDQYSNEARLGLMSNWSFIYGNNQKIQFRNLLNQNGISQTTMREGTDFGNSKLIKSHELAYESRTTYLGQLSGEHKLNNDKTELDWTFGYSFANKHEPDIRRVVYSKPSDSPENPYTLPITQVVNPDYLGRINLSNDESIWSAGANLVEHCIMGNLAPDLKLGFYSESKSRDFVARNIGFIQATNKFDYTLQSQPIDTIFKDENINYEKGITVSDATNLSDSYHAENQLIAGYLALNIPIGKKLNIYGGMRIEKNKQTLDGFDITNDTVHIVNDSINIFPSVNISYNITENLILRGAYGKTINRPEFREIAPYAFYDFEENAVIYGDTNLRNCYINNYDIRLEWYSTSSDMISLAGFYKQFSSPIEAALQSSGSGWNYTFQNADNSVSQGLELDLRKSLSFFNADNRFSAFMKNITLVFNTSLIKSNLHSSNAFIRDSVRTMQGQAPYIINGGIYYSDEKGWMVSILYNEVGKHIAFVGSPEYAHIYQMPKHQLDLTIQKQFANHFKIKAGVKNLLNDDELRQNIAGDHDVGQDQVTRQYSPGRSFNIGLMYSF